jgi:hypothetical protein
MRKKQVPRTIAKRLNNIGPQSAQRKVEGLARSVAQRIKHGEPPPPGYSSWHYAIMQFYRPMKEVLNRIKKLAAKG